MPAAKCRYCQANLITGNAYKVIIKKKNAYFCDEEHYALFIAKTEEEARAKQQAKEEARRQALAEKEIKQKEEEEAKRKRQEDKDKAYWLICEIIGRPAIIHGVIWNEWKIWNKVATNEVIAQYLEENRVYLINTISTLEDIESKRILYLSAILKNNLGDYTRKKREVEKPKTQVDNTFYAPTTTNSIKNNKRRSLADLEDET